MSIEVTVLTSLVLCLKRYFQYKITIQFCIQYLEINSNLLSESMVVFEEKREECSKGGLIETLL